MDLFLFRARHVYVIKPYIDDLFRENPFLPFSHSQLIEKQAASNGNVGITITFSDTVVVVLELHKKLFINRNSRVYHNSRTQSN